MISSLLSAELSACCNALGYSNGSKYYTDPYVKETMTDLIRYLRRDDEDHTIRRHLGSAKILQTDLLPILIHHSDKEDLFDVILRLLINLTNPALLIFQEELPTERTARHYFLEMISHLQSYKEAFTEQRVWEILSKKLGDLLQIEYHERDEDQSRTMERILILARNVLQVPADSTVEKRPDNDASIHDQVLWSLHQAGMVDLFLYIASTDNEQQFYMHVLEIVSLMLREQNPATLASSVLQRSVEEKEQDEKELLEIRRREIMEKQSKVKKYAGTRHSRFGGTFVVKNVKSISEKDLIYHKPVRNAMALSFDSDKQKSKVPKNKVSLAYSSSERRSAFSVRLFLKEFCVEFLNGAYNPLMHKVRENLVRAVGQPNDETYFFWAMKFFMEFNRLYKFQVKLVSETMHQQIFHFVQTQMENWLEQMVVDKKRIPLWSRRIHYALKAYQELLMTLQAMDKSPEHSVRESSRIIKSNIFYQSEYRELVVFLFNVYNETKFSRIYLKDLVETSHIFLKMLDQFCSRYQNVIVQAKARKITKKKKKAAKAKKSGATPADLEAIWDQVGPELSAVLQGPADIPTVVPFDAASDLSMDEQKIEAMKKIQQELKQGNFEQAIGLLRASREVWPENDSFGQVDIAPDEEFMAMREIFMAEIGQPAETVAEEHKSSEEDDEGDEEDSRNIVVPEQSFKLIEFIARFACPRVLAAVCQLLEQFDRNSNFTNHCVIKLLHRVAWDCKMPAMLFQASVFRTFQRIFKSTNPDHKELVKFAIFIMRKFCDVSKTNKKIYMELLFWKSKREAEEIEAGYGSTAAKSHSSKNVWREEQEDELRRLAAEYERETPESDAVGWIMKNMIDQSRSRRAVIKKLKELYLIVGNIKPSAKPKEFSVEEESELRALYEQFKEAADPMNCILGRMSLPRSRKTVVTKLLDMGLVSDKKQLRKKSITKEKKSSKNPFAQRSDDESIYDSWSDSEGEHAKSSSIEKATKTVRNGQPPKAQIHCNLRRVIESGLQEPLEWLKSSLQEVMEDLVGDEGDEEGTALLPLTPACVQAIDSPVFLQLLDVLCINKPTDQEMYWRIPGCWKAQDLTERINIINDALEGKLPDDESEGEDSVALTESPSTSKSLLKKIKQKKSTRKRSRNKAAKRNRKTPSSLIGSDDESSEEKSESIGEDNFEADLGSQKRKSVKLKKRMFKELDSDKENGFESSEATSDTDRNVINVKTDKKPLKITSDSDEDSVSGKQEGNGINKESVLTPSMVLLDSSDRENDQSITSLKDFTTNAEDYNVKRNDKCAVNFDSDEENYTRMKLANSEVIQSNVNSRNKQNKNTLIESESDQEETSINSLKTAVVSPISLSGDSTRSRLHDDNKTKRKKKLIVESESEDENEINNSFKNDNSDLKTNKRLSPKSENDSSNENQNKRKRLDSNSDFENDLVTQQVTSTEIVSNIKRKRLVIDSESDD